MELCPVFLFEVELLAYGWVAVSSIVDVLNLQRITSWSDTVVASSSTTQLVINSVEVGVAKVRSRMEVPVQFL